MQDRYGNEIIEGPYVLLPPITRKYARLVYVTPIADGFTIEDSYGRSHYDALPKPIADKLVPFQSPEDNIRFVLSKLERFK